MKLPKLNSLEFKKFLEMALALEHPYLERKIEKSLFKQLKLKEKAARAAVLALFAEDSTESGEWSLFLTKRTETVDTHKGQMAFPGGVQEQTESDIDTALRETHEEVGIPECHIQIVGKLPDLLTLSSGYWVSPVVAIFSENHTVYELKPNPHEIDSAYWVKIREFENYSQETFKAGPFEFPNHVYQVQEQRVWGATAAMIKNLLDRLKRVR